jgi:hypothetical protein
MNFEGSEFDLVFQGPFEMIFFLFVKFFVPNGYIIEIYSWTFILMGFLFTNFQSDFTTLANNIFHYEF